jgi:CheY-like chemotaxis protein
MSSSEKPGRPAAGLRVLVVEDEINVALLLEEMLTELGHTVIGPVARGGGPGVRIRKSAKGAEEILRQRRSGGDAMRFRRWHRVTAYEDMSPKRVAQVR